MTNVQGVPLQFDGNPMASGGSGQIHSFEEIPDLLTLAIPPVQWLVDGMIASGTMTLWAGGDGVAKTFLLMKMAVSVATGTDFLGRRCRPTRTLYLDHENPAFVVANRLELMVGAPIKNLRVWGTWLEQQPPPIGSGLLLEIAKQAKPLIIIDPFRYAHGAKENDSTEMMSVMQQLRYCAAVGASVIIVHHVGKAENSLARGSSAIKGAADLAFLQELDPENGLISLECTKNRFGERLTVTIRPDFETGTFAVTDSPAFQRRNDDMNRLKKIISEQPGINQNGVCGAAGMTKERAIRLLKDGVGSLWRTEPGSNRAIHYYPLGWLPNLGTSSGTTEPPTHQAGSGSVVLPPYRENHQNRSVEQEQPDNNNSPTPMLEVEL